MVDSRTSGLAANPPHGPLKTMMPTIQAKTNSILPYNNNQVYLEPFNASSILNNVPLSSNQFERNEFYRKEIPNLTSNLLLPKKEEPLYLDRVKLLNDKYVPSEPENPLISIFGIDLKK